MYNPFKNLLIRMLLSMLFVVWMTNVLMWSFKNCNSFYGPIYTHRYMLTIGDMHSHICPTLFVNLILTYDLSLKENWHLTKCSWILFLLNKLHKKIKLLMKVRQWNNKICLNFVLELEPLKLEINLIFISNLNLSW